MLQACQSLDPKQKFLCNDHEGRISYLSAQQAIQHDVAALVRQACIRSLSCEVRIALQALTKCLVKTFPSCQLMGLVCATVFVRLLLYGPHNALICWCTTGVVPVGTQTQVI